MQTLEKPKLENITLYYREGSSDKVYQCNIEPAGERFVVNFAYGRRGSTLNTGTKTNVPLSFEGAKRIFDKLVKEKTGKGYTPGENGTPYQQSPQQERFTGLIPQLLNAIEEDEVALLLADKSWCMQEKFNGRRMLIRKQDAEIQGINKKGLLIGLPQTVFNDISNLPGNFILDGESIGDVYYAFDLLALNTEDVRQLPYHERLASLVSLLAGAPHRFIKFAGTAYTAKEKDALLRQLKRELKEGVVFKRLDAPYTPGRPNSGGPQLKHKFYAQLSALVAKINQQRSIEVRLLDDEGWHHAGNVTIPANHKIPKVGDVVEVRYLYAHKESGVLYQPIYQGQRDDVDQNECLRSQLKFKPEEEI